MSRDDEKRVEFTVSGAVWREIELRRGLVPRAAWVKALIARELERSFHPDNLVERVAAATREEAASVDRATSGFRCHVPSCGFTAGSENARCFTHGGKLVPV